ncbi:hypothetical protein [Nocardioides sp.]|uniref:hypothetical protein n=1 Tax=Nocardioides sp. TaxID=35761 RepID=UPI003511AFE0
MLRRARLLAPLLLLLVPVAAHAAGGLDVDDRRGDGEFAAPDTAKYRALARSADIRGATAVISGERAVFTLVMDAPISALEPERGSNAAGGTWFVCTPGSSGSGEPCDGTIVTATIDDDVAVDVGWQGTAAPVPPCRPTGSVRGRLLVVKIAADCVRLTADVRLRASFGAVLKARRGSALLSDETRASRTGAL